MFANFRAVKVTGIGEGKLYRTASPINNENNRAAIANKLAEAAGVKFVMNMGGADEEIAAYAGGEAYLAKHGMTAEAITALMDNLK